jgi:uncharacterized membrane protein
MVFLKSLHVASAVLWLGNFVVTGIWSLRAFATKESVLRRFAVREILFTDLIFTFVMGGAVTMSGLGLAGIEGVAAWGTFWTRTALLTAIGSGVLWLAILLPLELRMRTLAATGRAEGDLMRAFVWWNIGGWAITVALFAVIYLMVAKPV